MLKGSDDVQQMLDDNIVMTQVSLPPPPKSFSPPSPLLISLSVLLSSSPSPSSSLPLSLSVSFASLIFLSNTRFCKLECTQAKSFSPFNKPYKDM